MKFLRAALSEIVGLFVDDWRFAVPLLLWVGLTAALAPHLPPTLPAPLFFLGLAALTLFFVVRQARRLRSRKK